MIRTLFLMLLTLIMVNLVTIDIVEATELDHETNSFLVQSNIDLQEFITMEEIRFYSMHAQTINITEDVAIQVKNLKSHQVGFSEEYTSVNAYYSEELIEELLFPIYNNKEDMDQISQFDFG